MIESTWVMYMLDIIRMIQPENHRQEPGQG
jgi:hypothetical protein